MSRPLRRRQGQSMRRPPRAPAGNRCRRGRSQRGEERGRRIREQSVDQHLPEMDQTETLLEFKEDVALTEKMRLRASSLQRSGQKRQDGERLLLPHEAVYRLDFGQRQLSFLRWDVSLSGSGRVTVTGVSQHWTPDLTHLMTRQLLEPVGTFWRAAERPDLPDLQCPEADVQEFGERIAELAKVRRVMYFLFAFKDGAEPSRLRCSLAFATR
ncbi:olfactory marker protein a [Stigmatopora argus]